MKKKYTHTSCDFLGKRICSVCAQLIKQRQKSPFSFATLHLHEDMDQAVTYVRRIPRTP